MAKKNNKIDGDNILYHYLQKDLLESDVWLFQMLVAKLVAELGIWFSPQLYAQLPIILPFAVRDPSCRRKASKSNEEEWGSPDSLGYFRDDNSLIKNLPSSLVIKSSGKRQIYHGSYIGKGFVASHIWRELLDSKVGANLSTRDPLTNSFVPNLVWLPRQVSKLTDREGSFTQIYLQALSAKIYREIPVAEPLRKHTEQVWDMLQIPTAIPQQGLPEIDDCGFKSEVHV